jgi:diguanylate cyclase (GGDEF)-like protein
MADPLQYTLDDQAILLAARVERFRVFNQRCITGAFSAFAGIGLLAWVIGSAVGWSRALLWAALIGVVEGAIILVGLHCKRVFDQAQEYPFWIRMQVGLAGLCSIVWGSAVWFIWTPGDTTPYLATVMMLVGVAGVSMVTMASHAVAALLFFSGIYLTPLLHVLLHTGPLTHFLLVGLLVGYFVQLGYTRELGRMVLHDAEQVARNSALVQLLHELVAHDQLTGAWSRRLIFERVDHLVSAYQRHGNQAAIIMFDLDHFKRINDTHGHATGDQALRETVKAVSAQLRDGDMLGRIGGEEFLVLLPMADQASALLLAQRLRQTLVDITLTDSAGGPVPLTASFGVAELGAGQSAADWTRRADAALYEAKAAGRNTVFAADAQPQASQHILQP